MIFRVPLTISIIILPGIFIIAFIVVLGFGLVLATVYVFFRDIRDIWEVILLAGFFLTPVFYPLSLIPTKYLPYYTLNPMTGLIASGREVTLYGVLPTSWYLIIPMLIGTLGLTVGYVVFKKYEFRFGIVA
jgi:ABC-type polysaccharide/polyol phosphate export permease